MNSLLYLDVSWNNLTNTRDEMSVLRKYMPVLSVLDIRHNNWQKVTKAMSLTQHMIFYYWWQSD